MGPPRLFGWGPVRSLQQIADETGGKAYYGRNDLDGAPLEGIADSRSSYTLGFYLTDVDGKYHELKVNVDRPGMALSYRQGYYAPDEPKLSVSQKKSELSAARLDPETLSMHESKAGQSGKVEEMFVEFNAAGREVARITATSPFEIRPENRHAFETNGVTMVQSFARAADATKLTIVVRDTTSGRVGSLAVRLDQASR